jgi:hypothetical protein
VDLAARFNAVTISATAIMGFLTCSRSNPLNDPRHAIVPAAGRPGGLLKNHDQ